MLSVEVWLLVTRRQKQKGMPREHWITLYKDETQFRPWSAKTGKWFQSITHCQAVWGAWPGLVSHSGHLRFSFMSRMEQALWSSMIQPYWTYWTGHVGLRQKAPKTSGRPSATVCLLSLAIIIADLTLQSQITGSLLVPSVHNEKCLFWDKVASFNKGGATLRQMARFYSVSHPFSF